MRALIVFFLWFLMAAASYGETAPETRRPVSPAPLPLQPSPQLPVPDDGVLVAPVVIDGEMLFRLRGVSAIPAGVRAMRARDAIIRVAKNPSLDPAAQRRIGKVREFGNQFWPRFDPDHFTGAALGTMGQFPVSGEDQAFKKTTAFFAAIFKYWHSLNLSRLRRYQS